MSREEQSLCNYVETKLRAAPGCDVVRVGDNLIATLPALAGRPRVVLCGHLDTVPENGNLPPRREGDRILGLGATDLKSGLAVIWRLLDELCGLVARGPSRELDQIDCDPAFVFYAREEIAFRESGLTRARGPGRRCARRSSRSASSRRRTRSNSAATGRCTRS